MLGTCFMCRLERWCYRVRTAHTSRITPHVLMCDECK